MGVSLSAGAMAGVAEHCVMYPVDSVKVRHLNRTVARETCSSVCRDMATKWCSKNVTPYPQNLKFYHFAFDSGGLVMNLIWYIRLSFFLEILVWTDIFYAIFRVKSKLFIISDSSPRCRLGVEIWRTSDVCRYRYLPVRFCPICWVELLWILSLLFQVL